MDEAIKVSGLSNGVDSKVKTNRTEYADGSYEEIRVEEVEGGFIKTVCTRKKDGDDWKYEDKKSVHTEDPLLDKTASGIASRLEKIMQNM
jgi:predicted transcriptional regulator